MQVRGVRGRRFGAGLLLATALLAPALGGCHSDDQAAGGTLPPGVTNPADAAKGVPPPVSADVQAKISAYQQAEAQNRAKNTPRSASLPDHR